jgi:hypothetical protein
VLATCAGRSASVGSDRIGRSYAINRLGAFCQLPTNFGLPCTPPIPRRERRLAGDAIDRTGGNGPDKLATELVRLQPTQRVAYRWTGKPG